MADSPFRAEPAKNALVHAWRMSGRSRVHAHRRRAGAFGLAADDYHRYRPRYPAALVTSLVTVDGECALDVGAGTGIASAQLQQAGAVVLAVEPDPRMARVVSDQTIPVEVATFEDWDAAGRSFDLVLFAQSFHWVDPDIALPKVASILRPDGRLALLSNRITPLSPTQPQLDEGYAGLLDASARPSIDAVHDSDLMAAIECHGYTMERRSVTESLHYTTDAWVDMVFTYSNVLMLTSEDRSELRSRLRQLIGGGGVDAVNDAVAVICSPSGSERQ